MKRRDVLKGAAVAAGVSVVGLGSEAEAVESVEFTLLTLCLTLEPGDAEHTWVEKRPKVFTPASKLITKFKEVMVPVVDRAVPAPDSHVKISFYEGVGVRPWLGGGTYEIESSVIWNGRWEMIDRAQCLALGQYRRKLLGPGVEQGEGYLLFPKYNELWPTYGDYRKWANEQRAKIQSVTVSTLIYTPQVNYNWRVTF